MVGSLSKWSAVKTCRARRDNNQSNHRPPTRDDVDGGRRLNHRNSTSLCKLYKLSSWLLFDNQFNQYENFITKVLGSRDTFPAKEPKDKTDLSCVTWIESFGEKSWGFLASLAIMWLRPFEQGVSHEIKIRYWFHKGRINMKTSSYIDPWSLYWSAHVWRSLLILRKMRRDSQNSVPTKNICLEWAAIFFVSVPLVLGYMFSS